MQLVMFVHGALSTKKSFSYIRPNLDLAGAQDVAFEYDIRVEPAYDTATRLANSALKHVRRVGANDVLFIAHSFGGVLSAEACRQLKDVKPDLRTRVVTLSTPFGGSSAADMLGVLKPSSIFFNNVKKHGQFMSYQRQQPLSCRTFSIVTTSGFAEKFLSANDGVVTVDSQMFYTKDPNWKHTEVNLNHFEVLLADNVVKLVQREVNRT